MAMLREPDVVEAVCNELESRGYKIPQKTPTNKQGVDIIATKHKITLHIEAKGATSSRKNSSRYDKSFTNSQVRTHVAVAFYKAAESLSTKSFKIRSGIALPDNAGHRSIVKNIKPILKKLGIAIFWVQESGSIKIDSRLTI